MLRPFVRFAVVAALAAAGPPAAAQTEVEIRASSAEYRVLDVSYGFENGLVLDAFYAGEEGLALVHAGAGYDFGSDERTSVIPFLYGVRGTGYDRRGATLGLYLSLDRGRWRTVAFLGHFFRTDGDLPDCSFVDSLDLTRTFGRWELGISASAYRFAVEPDVAAESAVRRNDRPIPPGVPPDADPVAIPNGENREITWLAGPILKRNDGAGAWAAAVRFGSDREFRLVRLFGF
jgi:hypothetical protein